jgi:hypothetical protein
MASILFLGSFLAGSLLTILIPICLLIALAIWGTRAIMRVPDDPVQTAPHAAGEAEAEGQAADGTQGAAKATRA